MRRRTLVGLAVAVLLGSQAGAPIAYAGEDAATQLSGVQTFSKFNSLIARAERLRLAERFDEAQDALLRAEAHAETETHRAMALLSKGLLLAQTADDRARAALEEALAAAVSAG